MSSRYSYIHLLLPLLLILGVTQLINDPLAQAETNSFDCTSVPGISPEGCEVSIVNLLAKRQRVGDHDLTSNVPENDVTGPTISFFPANGLHDTVHNVASVGTTTRVSVASDGTQGNDVSGTPRISPDGRYVGFSSWASNLVPGDTNNVRDVFVHEYHMGQTSRVSVASDGTEANGDSYLPSFSADGRYVAFHSEASNLVPGDNNGAWDVFVHDQQTGETARVSVASNGTQGNAGSVWPSVSANGRYVAFSSGASNLVPGDTNGAVDVFVHDRQTGQTSRVSVSSSGAQGNDSSSGPSISADGRHVAFYSDATNLVPGDTNGVRDVFVHDRQTGETTRVSVASNGAQANGMSQFSSISADGHYVAFESWASNLVPGDTNDAVDIFVHDRQTEETTRVSVASDGAQGVGGGSYWPSISADSRYVAFESNASNLVPDDTNGALDAFVHDRQTGQTSRISVATDGTQGNDDSHWPSISANGLYIAFHSWASNLVPDDTNGVRDNFIHDRSGIIPPEIHFLRLPIEYTGNAAIVAMGNNDRGGRVNSWFDHQIPKFGAANRDGYIWPWWSRIPLADPENVDCSFGLNCYDTHTGIDFQRVGNTDNAVAAADGTVVYAQWLGGGYGNSILIDHHNSYATFYAHLHSFYVAAGDIVSAGQQIGQVGNTGCGRCGIHLHFEVRYDPDETWPVSSVVDPYGWYFARLGIPDPASQADPPFHPSVWLWEFSLMTETTIDNTGGSQQDVTETIQVDFPPGAVSAPANFDLLRIPGLGHPVHQTTGRAFRLLRLPWENQDQRMLAAGDDFLEPVTISLSYDDHAVLGLDENSLVVIRWDQETETFVTLPTDIDIHNNVATAQTMTTGEFELVGDLLCANDVNEPDNNDGLAKEIGLAQTHTGVFSYAGDVDWLYFEVRAGHVYSVTISNLADGVQLLTRISDLDGNLLASGSNAANFEFTSSSNGRVFIELISTGSTGCSATYDVYVSDESAPLFLPLILKTSSNPSLLSHMTAPTTPTMSGNHAVTVRSSTSTVGRPKKAPVGPWP